MLLSPFRNQLWCVFGVIVLLEHLIVFNLKLMDWTFVDLLFVH